MSIEKLIHDELRDGIAGWQIGEVDEGVPYFAACEIADVIGPKLVDLIRAELTSDKVMKAAVGAVHHDQRPDEMTGDWQERTTRAVLARAATALCGERAMPPARRTEYGVICDRTEQGFDRALIATGTNADLVQEFATKCCRVHDEHPHVLVKCTVTVSDWEDVQ